MPEQFRIIFDRYLLDMDILSRICDPGPGVDWGQKVAMDFLAQAGPPNLVRSILHHTINELHFLDIIICLFWCI